MHFEIWQLCSWRQRKVSRYSDCAGRSFALIKVNPFLEGEVYNDTGIASKSCEFPAWNNSEIKIADFVDVDRVCILNLFLEQKCTCSSRKEGYCDKDAMTVKKVGSAFIRTVKGKQGESARNLFGYSLLCICKEFNSTQSIHHHQSGVT